jgi:integrase
MASAKVLPKSTNPRARRPYCVRFWDNQGAQRERSFRTLEEARQFRTRFEHESREGSYVDRRNGSQPFAAYAEAWLSNLDRKPLTVAAYRQALTKHIAPHYGARTLADVAQDREGFQALLAKLREAGTLGAMRQVGTVVTQALEEAVRAGRIPSHRLGGVKIERAPSAQPATVIPATRAQLEQVAQGMRPGWGLAVWLMRGCGLRISEALAVRADDFRTNGAITLRVSRQISRDGQPAPLKDRREGEYRDVPVPAWLWAMAGAHIQAQGITDGGYLFRDASGKHVISDRFREQFRAQCQRAGLPDGFHPHMLRHLFASQLLAAGVPLSDVSKFLGHRSFNVTFQTYSHLVPSSWDRARDALESLGD